MAVTRSQAQAHLAELINSGQVKTQKEAQERLSEFINSGGEVEEPSIEIDTTPDELDIPEAEDLSPIQQEEREFEERVAPIQQISIEAGRKEAEERKARRLAGEGTVGERIEDVLFTRDVTESGKAGPLDELSGLSSLPARALAAAFKFGEEGDIAEEKTKLFEPAITSLNAWAENPENSGATTRVAQLLGNLALETASDPTAIVGLIKNAATSTLKAMGKTATKEQIESLAEQAVKQTDVKVQEIGRKKLRATDIDPEKLLVESGGGEAVVKRLGDKGIGITSAGEINIPQTTLDNNIEKLKKVRIEEFDVTDQIESTVIPLNKKEFIKRSLRDEIKDPTELEDLSQALVNAKTSTRDASKALRDAGFDAPNQISAFVTRLGDRVTGEEARDLITTLNKRIGDPSRSLSQSKVRLSKFNQGLKEELKKAVGASVPDDALEDYINLREIGTEKFTTKTGKLRNILKRKGDKTLDEKASINAMEQMIFEAMTEVKTGRPGKSFKNLEEIDRIAGTDMASIAKDAGLAERFNLNIKGEISAVPKDVKAPPKTSVVQGGIVGGQPGAFGIALKNTASDIVNSINRKRVKSAVNAIFKEKGKLKIKQDTFKEAIKDVEAGKKLILSEIDRGNALKVFDVLTSKGIITARQVAQQLGGERAMELSEEASRSSDNRIRAYGKKLEKEAEKVSPVEETIETTGDRSATGQGTSKQLQQAVKILRSAQKENPASVRRAVDILSVIPESSSDFKEAQGLLKSAQKRLDRLGG